MIEIVKWNQTFENADTRKRQRLKSFHCPSGCESRGLVNLLCETSDQKDALMAFGVFQMLCQFAATLPADHRGRFIHSDGKAMTADYIARILRIEICHLSAALELLSRERVAWISMGSENPDLPHSCQSSPGFVQGEGEGEGEGEGTPLAPKGQDWIPDPVQKRINSWFGRRDSTRWSDRERKAFGKLKIDPESDDFAIIERYYLAEESDDTRYRRKDIGTLLNNWTGETDRARRWAQKHPEAGYELQF